MVDKFFIKYILNFLIFFGYKLLFGKEKWWYFNFKIEDFFMLWYRDFYFKESLIKDGCDNLIFL